MPANSSRIMLDDSRLEELEENQSAIVPLKSSPHHSICNGHVNCHDDINRTSRQSLSSQRRRGVCNRSICSRVAQYVIKYRKFLLSFLYLVVSMFISALCTVFVHERVPDPAKYPALPDLILDAIPCWPWGLKASEWTLNTLNVTWLIIACFHNQRFVVLQRFFQIVSTTYLLRCSTMLFTSPSPAPQCSIPACGPLPMKSTADRFKRAVRILIGGGMSINDVQTCGDYIFSGHTAILSLTCHFIIYYTPKWCLPFHILCVLACISGIYFTLAHHGHYTVDIVLGLIMTWLLFRSYHAVVRSISVSRDLQTKWFRFFFPLLTYFECDVEHPIVNTFGCPVEKFQCWRQLRSRLNRCIYRREQSTEVRQTFSHV